MTQNDDAFVCPVCDGTSLGDYRGRARARCRSCGAFERSRLLQLVLRALDVSSFQGSVLHLAPEIGIARTLHGIFGDRYVACDLKPDIYEGKGFAVRSLDVCRDLPAMKTGSVGCFIHVHVLEHVRCNAAQVMANIGRILSPGGYHVMGLPFMEGHYREDQDPTMSEKRRLELFGHEDHMRSFGTADFETMFGATLTDGLTELDVTKMVDPSKLKLAAIPGRALSRSSSHSIRVYQKRA